MSAPGGTGLLQALEESKALPDDHRVVGISEDGTYHECPITTNRTEATLFAFLFSKQFPGCLFEAVYCGAPPDL